MNYAFNLQDGDYKSNLINILSKNEINLHQTYGEKTNEQDIIRELSNFIILVGKTLSEKRILNSPQEIGSTELGLLYMIRNELFASAREGNNNNIYSTEITKWSRVVSGVFSTLSQNRDFRAGLESLRDSYINVFKTGKPGAEPARGFNPTDDEKYQRGMGRFASFLAMGFIKLAGDDIRVFADPATVFAAADGRAIKETLDFSAKAREGRPALANNAGEIARDRDDDDSTAKYNAYHRQYFGYDGTRAFNAVTGAQKFYEYIAELLDIDQNSLYDATINGFFTLAANAGQAINDDTFREFVAKVYQRIPILDVNALNDRLDKFIELLFVFPLESIFQNKDTFSVLDYLATGNIGAGINITQATAINNNDQKQSGGNVKPYSFLNNLNLKFPYSDLLYSVVYSNKSVQEIEKELKMKGVYATFENEFRNKYGATKVLTKFVNEIIEKKDYVKNEKVKEAILASFKRIINKTTIVDNKLSSIMPNIDPKYRGSMDSSFNNFTDNYKIKSLNYSTKNDLRNMLSEMVNTFDYTKYQESSYKLDRFDDWNTNLFRKEIINNYKMNRDFFEKSVELFKETNYGRFIPTVSQIALTPEKQYEDLRAMKRQYGEAIFKLFENLMVYKYDVDKKFHNVFVNEIRDAKAYKEIEEAYELYIKMIKNKIGSASIEELAKYALSIGSNVYSWEYGYKSKMDINDSKTIDDALRILNYRINKVTNKYKNKNRMDVVGSVIVGIKRKALCELLGFRSMSKIIQPLMDVINFDLLLGKTSPDNEDNIVFEMKDVKDLTLKEFIKKFIETYIDLKRGYTTTKNYMFTKKGFFLDLNDEDLRPGKERIQKLLEEYMGKLEEWRDADVKETEKKKRKKELDEKDVEEKPEMNKTLEKVSTESVVKPLMGVNRTSVVSVECEYSKNSNGSGVNIELKNCSEEANRGIVAIPFVSGVDKGPIRLNGGKGTFSNVDIDDNTVIHFYYTPVNEPGVRIDGSKFIGSVKLHNITTNGKAKNLKVKYVEKNLDSKGSETIISDYGDKIIVQLPNSVNAKSTLFITVNTPKTGDNSAENLKHSIVTTKDGKSLLIIDEKQLLNVLGDKFELHLYNSRLAGETYNTKLEIDRNATEDSKPSLEDGDNEKPGNKIKGNKDKLEKELEKGLKLKKASKKKVKDEDEDDDIETDDEEKDDEDEDEDKDKKNKKYTILDDNNYFSNLGGFNDYSGFNNYSIF